MQAPVLASVLAPIDPDELVVRSWLHGRQRKTIIAYTSDSTAFRSHVGKPLATVTLADLQDYAASLEHLAHATRARRLASVKSLTAFAHRLGAIPFDPGSALRVAKVQSTTAERIISERDMGRMIATERDPRRQAALRLLYVGAFRAEELCALRWRDLAGSDKKGWQVQVLGKGAKRRIVPLPNDLIRDLAALTPSHQAEDPIVPGQGGGALLYGAVFRIVKRAAKRIGLPPNVSPHYCRHAGLSHALDNGAPVHEVRELAGHASLATTTGYAHAKKGDGLARYLKSA